MYKNKKGFTLIEIIVVLVITACLLAVSVPSILKYLDKANEATVLHDARGFMLSVQSIAIKEYGSDNAYSPSAPSEFQITYEAITNMRPRPDNKAEHDRIRAIYDLLDVSKIEGNFEAIALVDHGDLSIIRYRSHKNNLIYEWRKDDAVWRELDIDEHPSWAGEILPEELLGSGIWWNGYTP